MIAVTFALPQESKDFVALLRSPGGSAGHISPAIFGNLGDAEILLWHTGVGAEAARETVSTVLRLHEPDVLISAGFAGALDPDLSVGDVVIAPNQSDAELLKKLPLAQTGIISADLVSEDHPVETPEAKTALHQRTGAAAVDMETAAIHAICKGHGLPFLSVRAISDAAQTALPIPFATWFDLRHQRPRALALMFHLLRNPKKVRPFIRFVQGVELARRNLTGALVRVIPQI